LRDGLQESLLQAGASFSEVVRQAQRNLAPPELVLDIGRRVIRCGATLIPLPPVEFAFLAWFARRTLAGQPGICRTDVRPEETAAFLAEYRVVAGEMSGDCDRVEHTLREGMEYTYFDQRRSLLHKHLNKALGKAGAQPYLIESNQRRPRSRYALNLKPKQIRFGEIED